jgi:hypothetical protein
VTPAGAIHEVLPTSLKISTKLNKPSDGVKLQENFPMHSSAITAKTLLALQLDVL